MTPRPTDQLVVPLEVSDFPAGSPVNNVKELNVCWADLLWASITVGKAQRDLMRFGEYSFAEMLHRVACLHAYYEIDGSNRMCPSPASQDLDPSERGVVSYYIGMAMAKLFADKVLNIPWMMHISRYEVDWSVRYGADPDRPDLFGCNSAGEWAVAEAKGRARVTKKLVTKMQKQKSAVASIQAVAPTHRYGSATRLEGGQLALRVVDPPPRRRAQEIPLDPAAWLVDYFAPIVDLLSQVGGHLEGQLVVGTLPGTDIEIGVPATIAETVRESRDILYERAAPRPAERGEIIGERPTLIEQTPSPAERNVVERLTASAREVLSMEGAMSDGLVVRSRLS